MRATGRVSIQPEAPASGGASRRPSRRRRPSRWGIWLRRRLRLHRRRRGTRLRPQGWYCLGVLLALLLVALSRQMNLVFILAGVLVGTLWLNWRWASRALSRLEPRRQLPESVCAGDLLLVRVGLTNRQRRRAVWAVQVHDTVRLERPAGGAFRTLDPAVLFLRVPAGQSRAAVYRGRLLRRGRYRFGPLQIATRFPFGLLERRVTISQSDILYVYPKLGYLTQHWFAQQQRHFEGSGYRERRGQRTVGEFYGVRDWQDGDSRRLIHWRSTVRHGTLVVRQFEQPRNPDVVLILDLCRTHPQGPNLEELVERAVAFVATVVADLCRKGGAHLVVAIGGVQPACVAGPTSPVLLQNVMKSLAVAEPSVETQWAALIREATGRASPGSHVILVSTATLTAVDRGEITQSGRRWGNVALAGRLQVIEAADQLDRFFRWS